MDGVTYERPTPARLMVCLGVDKDEDTDMMWEAKPVDLKKFGLVKRTEVRYAR